MSTQTNKKRPATPATVKTDAELCAMRGGSVTVGDYWMLIQPIATSRLGYEMVLVHQKLNAEATAKIHIPRHIFAKFVRWFETGRVR